MSASIDTYRNINVGTANPHHIIVKLYDAAIRFLDEAELALKNDQRCDEPLSNVQTIIGGLMTSLNFEAGKISQNLLQLYLFALDRVQTAQVKGEVSAIVEARNVLATLKAGWDEVSSEEASASMNARPSVGLNLKG